MSSFGQPRVGREEPETRLWAGHNGDDDGINGNTNIEMIGLENIANSSEMGKKKKRQQLQEWMGFLQDNFSAGLCVVSLLVDPLFFYIPVINEVGKCVDFDTTLYNIIVCLRTLLDFISLAEIIWKFPHSLHLEKKRYWTVANDIVAILPIPQVLFLILFSKMRSSSSLNKRKVLSGVVLFQYLPRALRLYLSWTKFRNIMISKLSKSVIAVKGGFYLFIILIASHIIGGFWYFFSVEQEIACWHLACEKRSECDPGSFACNHGSFGNYIFLNESCPIATPNTTVFDFGIFQGALQSGTVASMDFPGKILFCFWWGLQNLSSFGSNLQTSSYFWENGFAIFTSICGMLLFFGVLGHWQGEASRQLDEVQKWQLDEARQRKLEESQREQQLEEFKQRWKSRMNARRNKIIKWIDRRRRLSEIKNEIMRLVDGMFEEKETQIMSEAVKNLVAAESKMPPSEYEDIDAENPLTHLPLVIRRKIRHHLCFPLLLKVPLLQKEREDVLTLISNDFIKEVYYAENSYIAREGEPLDALLFITQGIVFTYTTASDHRQSRFIKADGFDGVELIEWMYNSVSAFLDPSRHPFSTRTLRCHTKVEGFALTAGNIQHLLNQHSSILWKFRDTETRVNHAALTIQAAFRRRLIPEEGNTT